MKKQIELLDEIFSEIHKGRRVVAEKILLDMLRNIVLRNPENRMVRNEDFEIIALLLLDFDEEYKAWLRTTTQTTFRTGYESGHSLLLSVCKDKDRMETLLEDVFLYLQREAFKSQQSILEYIERYNN